MSGALSDTSHTTSSVRGKHSGGAATSTTHIQTHRHMQTNTGVTLSLVSPGDSNFTTKLTRKRGGEVETFSG